MIEVLKKLGNVLENVSLKNYNTYKIGGNAKYLVEPFDVDSLKKLIKYLKDNKIKYFILGNGSNVILDDLDFEGVIIKLSNLKRININNNEVYAEAGIMLPILSRETINHNLQGLEWSCAIPGTLGGSIVGNAGAYKECIFDYVTKIDVLDKECNIKTLDKNDITYSYRYTSFKDDKDLIVLGAYLSLNDGNKEELLEVVKRRMQKRMETQPLDYPSAGSVFRNPENDFAGRIIEEDIKFKGKQVGGAKVSEKHANFIINYDNATSKDIKELISLIKKNVKEKEHIELILEQEIINWE